MAPRPWTKADNDLLLDWYGLKHIGWGSIGLKLNRTPQACAAQYQRLQNPQREKPFMTLSEIHDARLTERGRKREAEREARIQAATARAEAELAEGRITSTYFGDPPPGWSALDRKRKVEHA
ncbi:hypothetical protein ASD45_08440 [Pseudolabrys sp. Root1462]|uniref:hypothetical protein n=1 Tax=Pseudolabrys sp. Root1462 TaxID=1736466 RepID=UPI000703156F|nr:hypothetical protein [Pseudolabrys sp. Root1462]KQZ00881.1 hypothetical protein ASD45_08440 [Pseudolabrys sp. Root1462]